MRIFWILSLLLVAATGSAEDWYWRPFKASPYGTGNGTTYNNAWRAASEVRWIAMRPGDVLFFCGMHNAGEDDRQIIVGAPGVRVSGACPGDPGTLWSTGQKLTAWGRTDTAGVYRAAYAGSTVQALNASQQPLTRLSARPGASSPCNSWFHGHVFYYKPCGAPVAVHPSGPTPAVLVRHPDVTIEDLTVLNTNRLVEVRDAARVTLTRLHLYRGAKMGIELTGTTRGGKVLGSEIHHVGNGIYAITTGPDSHNGWLIEGNYIHHVAAGPDGDEHCIGWQNGNNNRIRANRLQACAGPALAIYWKVQSGQLRNNEWSYNEIDSPANTAISISGDNCPPVPTDAGANVVLGNQITGGPLGIYVKVAPWSLSVLDNVVSGAEVGLKWKHISGGNSDDDAPPFIDAGNTWNVLRSSYDRPPATRACE